MHQPEKRQAELTDEIALNCEKIAGYDERIAANNTQIKALLDANEECNAGKAECNENIQKLLKDIKMLTSTISVSMLKTPVKDEPKSSTMLKPQAQRPTEESFQLNNFFDEERMEVSRNCTVKTRKLDSGPDVVQPKKSRFFPPRSEQTSRPLSLNRSTFVRRLTGFPPLKPSTLQRQIEASELQVAEQRKLEEKKMEEDERKEAKRQADQQRREAKQAEEKRKKERRNEEERRREEKRQEDERKREEKRKEEEKKKEEKRQEDERRREEKRKEEEKKKEEKRLEDERKREEKRKEEEKKKEEKRLEDERRREEKRKEEQRRLEEKEIEKQRKIQEKQKEKDAKVNERKRKGASYEQELQRLANLPPFVVSADPIVMLAQRRTMPENLATWSLEEIQENALPKNALPMKKQTPVQRIKRAHPKAKLFGFSENVRPAYYGTWRKKPRDGVSGRRPLGKMTDIDYEVDSDQEWHQEVEDADECLSTEEFQEEDSETDEDLIGFRVPACHLSEGEGDSTCDSTIARPKESKEMREQRLLNRAKSWEESIQKKKTIIVPTILGPLYEKAPPFCEHLEIVVFD